MPERTERIDRATFLKRSSALLVGAIIHRAPPGRVVRLADPSGLDHPEPRQGITSERVLAADALGSPRRAQDVIEAYDAARTYPQIFDGLACGCGCTGKNGEHRSLLVCYETKQPTGCASCQLEAKLVGGLAKQNTTLAEIRAQVDKKFG